jgi:hypothetical protein
MIRRGRAIAAPGRIEMGSSSLSLPALLDRCAASAATAATSRSAYTRPSRERAPRCSESSLTASSRGASGAMGTGYSYDPGDGKTTVARHLARAAARMGSRPWRGVACVASMFCSSRVSKPLDPGFGIVPKNDRASRPLRGRNGCRKLAKSQPRSGLGPPRSLPSDTVACVFPRLVARRHRAHTSVTPAN